MKHEPARAESRILNLLIHQCSQVIKRFQRMLDDSELSLSPETRESLQVIVAERKRDRQEMIAYAKKHEISTKTKFPTPDNAASILGRIGDPLLNISATQSAHSAFYGALREYTVDEDDSRQVVGLESGNREDRRKLVRAALSLMAFAASSAFSFLGWAELAQGAVVEGRLVLSRTEAVKG